MSAYDPEFGYKERLDAILSAPLSPEIISTYADVALGQVVELVEDYTSDYLSQTEQRFGNMVEAETAATGYWGLRDINEVLGHLSETSSRISNLAVVIGRTVCRPDVIVPPDVARRFDMAPGGDGFEAKNTIDRLKTTLFILQNDFDIDIHDPDELQLVSGVVTDTMLRKESYYGILVPELERVILVCDEEGNASYVFNTAKLRELGLDEDRLFESTKQGLNELLDTHNEVGQRVVYSKLFVHRMKRVIEQPITEPDSIEKPESPESSSYLYPKAPEGILSAAGISNETGLPYRLIQRSIASLKGALGDTSIYRFGANSVPGYSPEQQQVIVAKLIEQQELAIPSAPDGYLSLSKFARELGVSTRSINQAIEELGEDIGELGLFMFFSKEAVGCSPEQQQMIRTKLSEPRKRVPSGIPEGHLSATALATNIGKDRNKVQRVIAELGESLTQLSTAETRLKKKYYSPEQQQMITDRIAELEDSLPTAPEGILSVRGMSQKFGVHVNTILTAIDELGDELGEAKTYMFSRPVAGYTLEQQTALENYLNSKGVLVPIAGPDVSSFRSFQDTNHIARPTLLKVIEELGDAFGDIRRYRFGSKKRPGDGLSAEQQQMIIARLQER